MTSVESEEIESSTEGESSLLQAYAAMKQLSGYAGIETAMGAGRLDTAASDLEICRSRG